MPRPSPWNRFGPGRDRVVALGGGHGLTAVLHALRDDPFELTVIVTVADDGGSSGELRRRREGPAVGDMRRALISLADDDAALARAFARPLAIDCLGRHPLGNLVIRSVADAFGDLEQASEWLGEQLRISGRVLPASSEPVSLLAEAGNDLIYGERAIGSAQAMIRRVRFRPERPSVPKATCERIDQADLVLLGPGSLFTSVLAASALPDLAAALARSAARVVWICNLEPERNETAGMTACDHLAALRRHGVRVDAVLYDPGAKLHFASEHLERQGLEPLPRFLRSAQPGVHDPALLRVALKELLSRPGRARTAPPREAHVQRLNASAQRGPLHGGAQRATLSLVRPGAGATQYHNLIAAPGSKPRKRA